MAQVSIDQTTGNVVHSKEHKVLVTMVDDAAYLTLMVMVYDYTGLNRFFLQLPGAMSMSAYSVQALRYGLLFGSMLELRRWLETYGIMTDLSCYLARAADWFK